MGYVLLWSEHLAAGLLLVATLVACISQLKRTWLRVVLSLLVALPLVGYAVLLYILGDLRFREMILVECFYPFVFLTACYVIGAALILFVGLRRRGDDPALASTWARGKLALMAFVVVGLHMMTWWNMELSVRQHMATLESEAGALRLSLAPAHLPDRDNAAVIYEQTYDALSRDSLPEALRDNWHDWHTWWRPPKLNDPELKTFLDEQAATLILLRQGGQKPGCHFGRDFGRMNLYSELPELKLADAARLLSLDAAYRAVHGDMPSAIADVNAIFAIAEHMSADPLLISTHTSSAVHEIAVETLQHVIFIDRLPDGGRLTIEQLQSINLESSLSFRRSYRRALQGELAGGLTLFPMFSRDADTWLIVASLIGTGGDLQSAHRLPVSFYRMFMVNSDVASYRQMVNSLRELAAKPYHEAQSDFENFEQTFKSKPHGFLAGQFAPVFADFAKKLAISDSRHQTARIALAAERFRFGEGKGDLPENLDALVPDYLATLPRDPFDGKPMKYHRINDGHARIYSVGPDGTDDKGSKRVGENGEKGDVVFELIWEYQWQGEDIR